jgi:NAD(P)H dehydrogenase (quinone)
MNGSSQQPTVLVLGSSGQIGQLVVKELEQSPDVRLRLSSRRPEEVERLRQEGKEAVHLDLDDPKTFPLALAGVDRIFLLTGYTVAMVTQSKTLIDAARKAGVKHIVHLGVFAEWDCTDPHFAWHLLIESYIQASGLGWTHLHPNVFMDNLLNFSAPRADRLTLYWGKRSVGWIAVSDIAAVAAAVLNEGPGKHHGRDYWMSTDVLNGSEVAEILSEVTGRSIGCNLLGPEEFKELISSPGIQVEPWYAAGGLDFMRQVSDGRMGYIGTVRDDVPYVLGRPALTFREWASAHKEEFIQIASLDAAPARLGSARSKEQARD